MSELDREIITLWVGDYSWADGQTITEGPFLRRSEMGAGENWRESPTEGRKRDVVLHCYTADGERGVLQQLERMMHKDAHPPPTEAFCITLVADEWENTVSSAWLQTGPPFFFVIMVNEVPSEEAGQANSGRKQGPIKGESLYLIFTALYKTTATN